MKYKGTELFKALMEGKKFEQGTRKLYMDVNNEVFGPFIVKANDGELLRAFESLSSEWTLIEEPKQTTDRYKLIAQVMRRFRTARIFWLGQQPAQIGTIRLRCRTVSMSPATNGPPLTKTTSQLANRRSL